MEIVLYKYDSRLNHLLPFKDSSPNPLKNFSFEIHLIASVVANSALYWIVSVLSDKRELLS